LLEGYNMSASRFRSPLKRARGLGSAKEGSHHWISQRISAIALVPLVLWFVFAAVTQLAQADYYTAITWLKDPVHALLLALFIVVSLQHAMLGVQVVIEDYIHCEVMKISALLAVRFVLILASVISVFVIVTTYIKG
jgi:succinate dehydrogenase / fumarate reductase, membrane anchor subunit